MPAKLAAPIGFCTNPGAVRRSAVAKGQPHAGAYFFHGGLNTAATEAILRQDIDLIAAGFTPKELDTGTALDAEAWLRNYYGANVFDDQVFYRLVAIAADANPSSATAVMLEFGVTFRPDGTRDPLSRGELRVDGVVEMTGAPPFELFIRRTTATTKGVSIRNLTGAELASWSCPR